MSHQSNLIHLRLLLIFLLASPFLYASTKKTAFSNSDFSDSLAESKVDYLERIYFSGGTKEELINSISSTLQEFDQAKGKKTVSSALGAQMLFLTGIKDKAEAAKEACDITDMLAVGIYNLDNNEAVLQNIPKPSEKASASLNTITNSIQKVSSNAGSLIWDTYVLSNGKYNALGLASKAGGSTTSANKKLEAGKQAVDIAKGLGLLNKKDKACKSVPTKTVVLSNHTVDSSTQSTAFKTSNVDDNPASNVTTDKKTIIKINGGINYEKLSAMEQNIKACSNVKTTIKKFNTSQSTIEVTHTGSTDDLVGLMLQTCKSNFSSDNLSAVEDGAIAINLPAAAMKKNK